MDLDELQSVRDRERQTDKLQQLRTSFYADAADFIQDLRDQRSRAAERVDNPFDAPEVNRLSDEIDTAEQTVEAIYEKRVGKLVKAASLAAADLPAAVEGMTAEEEELFDSLVGDIKENRGHVLDILDGQQAPGETGSDEEATTQTADDSPADRPIPPPDDGVNETPPGDSESPAESAVDAADLMGATSTDPDATNEDDTDAARSTGEDATDPSAARNPPVRNDGGTAAVERATIRVTDDVGEILGVDQRAYDLSENDVVVLPSPNVDPLVERGAASRLEE